MNPEYAREAGIEDSKTFWWSLMSAVSVLVLLGAIIYLSQINKQNASTLTNPGFEQGVGGRPGSVSSPTPIPTQFLLNSMEVRSKTFAQSNKQQ